MMEIKIDECYNIDCYEGMCLMQKQGIIADWCISDPPYGIGIAKQMFKKSGKRLGKAQCREYNNKTWDDQRIGKKYFDKMREVSREQIIWGGGIIRTIYP